MWIWNDLNWDFFQSLVHFSPISHALDWALFADHTAKKIDPKGRQGLAFNLRSHYRSYVYNV